MSDIRFRFTLSKQITFTIPHPSYHNLRSRFKLRKGSPNVLEPSEILRFYSNWAEPPHLSEWKHQWRKEFRVQLPDDAFLSLNRLKDRLTFHSLKKLCTALTPIHVYQTACNFLLPRRVSKKRKASKAYPIGSGEYEVNIDSYLNHKPHSHRTRNNEACLSCLENAKELFMRVLDKLAENYKDIRIVFSGSARI